MEHDLKELRLPSFLREYGKLAAQCASENVAHPEYLLRLAGMEFIDRHQRMVERQIRAAKFPAVKRLGTFDFGQVPSSSVRGVIPFSAFSPLPARLLAPARPRYLGCCAW